MKNSDRNSEASGRVSAKPGQVAWFDFLHLNTADWKRDHPSKSGCKIFEVEGKERPMLVVDGPTERRYGRWYLVLKLTTRGSQGKRYAGEQPVGDLLGNGKQAVAVVDELLQMPECLLSSRNGRAIDKLAFDAITAWARHRVLIAEGRADSLAAKIARNGPSA